MTDEKISEMNFLEQIVEMKRRELEDVKRSMPVEELMDHPLFGRQTISLKESLNSADPCGIIAEFKRKSPSKGIINWSVTVEDIVKGYVAAGAAGLSILTDPEFFGGSLTDMRRARAVSGNTPILRKDFIIDEYQVLEAKAFGADVILLIAEILTPKEIERFSRLAKDNSLEVLLEMHHSDQLDKICEEVDIVGINNRNLEDFSVDIDISIKISGKLPQGKTRISESGLDSADKICKLVSAGYCGFLIGEYFMKQPHPPEACLDLINSLKKDAR
jgi:indole-3-glycerol phosphate synthase